MTPGSSDIDKFQSSDVDIGLRRDLSGSALPNPAIRFARGTHFEASLVRFRYGLSGCSPPCTDLTGFPASGGFYIQASNAVGTLLDMTTTVTEFLCWRVFHPQEWQLASLHQILAAKLIGGKRTQYRIQGVRGLMLDVRPSGQRTWFVRYQPGGRKSRKFRWYKIGDARTFGLKDAMDRADEVVRAVQGENRDPHAERVAEVREGQTFGELFEDWFTRHAEPKLARASTDRTVYRCHVEPVFAKARLADLKRVEIGRFRDKVAKDASPLTSNTAVELIGRVLNWALDEGMIEVNPAARLRKIGIRRPRERVLQHEDIRTFWNALTAMETMTCEHMARGEKGRMLSPATRAILRLLLLTGQRRGEVVGAMKSELVFEGKEPVWMSSGTQHGPPIGVQS